MHYTPYTNRTLDKLRHLTEAYSKMIFVPVGELDAQYLTTSEHLRLPPENGWQPVGRGTKWGGEYANIWVRGSYTVPDELAGRTIYALPVTGAVEVLCYRDGKPCGIINSKNDFAGGNHCETRICSDAVPGARYELAFECYAGHYCVGTSPMDSYGRNQPGEHDFERVYDCVKICYMDTEMKDFVFDLRTVLQFTRLNDDAAIKGEALNALEKLYASLPAYPIEYSDAELREAAREGRKILAPVLAKTSPDASRGTVGIIGHSHMDTAWLWPVSETVRKCARTYSKALALMEEYPEYTFIQSSALHLDWMRRYYPAIFEGIKARVAEGRYEPNGGVWVECDCNVTSGELMARQFIYGQRFTREYLEYTSDSFWLPDTFGYNAAIPQIMKECGVKYFYTTKLSWNDLNRFPAETFLWRGLDGSEVITHFFKMHCFPDPENVMDAISSLQNRRDDDTRLLAYGFGDGGGGPTYGMLESARRVRDVAGMPVVKSTTASGFMHAIEEHSDRLPVYDGELYLELHRGTLTQMHGIKRYNRKSEFALRDMEFMNVAAGEGKNPETDRLYKILLTNQFHDILPGTCITPVYEKAYRELAGLIDETQAITAAYGEKLAAPAENEVTLINTLSFDRADTVYLDGTVADIEGGSAQAFTDVMGREKTAVNGVHIPAFGAKTVKIRDTGVIYSSPFVFSGNTLDTPVMTVVFDADGMITSLFDKAAKREVAGGGLPLGAFTMAEDVPASWDNWDIDNDIASKARTDYRLVSRDVIGNGAVELRIRCVYETGRDSTITVDQIFKPDSMRIDYHAAIDWHDPHRLCKVAFDVNVSAPKARHEIQFGHVERPTTRNNSIEAAMFEVCNHKWSDVSETRYGVAVLNDCKYGISAERTDRATTVLALTLHKGGTHPDITGDAGLHEMTWSLLPHAGSFNAENVVRDAYELNVPPLAVSGAASFIPLLSIDAPNVICEAVKPAEDIEGAYVLRLYECERSATSAALTFGTAPAAVWEANMLEEKKADLPLDGREVELTFRPFEIKTVVVKK